MNNKIISEIINCINEFDTIIIHRHIRPDGDAVGTSLGLRELLKNSFQNKKVYSVGFDTPEYLSVFGDVDVISDEEYQNALVIVVDTADHTRISDERYSLAKKIIKIDHHINNDNFGDINLVEEDYVACALLVAEMAELNSHVFKLNNSSAELLYLGIITDTGRFKFGVNENTLAITSKLLKYEFDIEKMFAYLYTKDFETYKFSGWVYNNFEITENGVAYIYITNEVKERYKISNEDASNTVNMLDSIKGSLIWVLFNEQDNEIRVRLRSRFVAINLLANEFNGGGHANACGATVYSKEEAMNLISKCDKLLKIFKESNTDKF